MNNQANKIPMKLGCHTYGYYFHSSNEFYCSHGGWCSPVEWKDDENKTIKLKLISRVFNYEIIDSIPEEFDYT